MFSENDIRERIKQPHIVALTDTQITGWRHHLLDLLIEGKRYEGLTTNIMKVLGYSPISQSEHLEYKDEYEDSDTETVYIDVMSFSDAAANTIIQVMNDIYTNAHLSIKDSVIYDETEPITLQQVFQRYLRPV